MKRRQATGFTVIELAVIIVVIGILATIILVVYNRAQSDARDSKRANDARVIDAALNKYFDANGMYPSGCGGTSCGGLSYPMQVPNTDIISTQTTQTQLATMLGTNVAQVRDPKSSDARPFIGAGNSIDNATPGYIYRGAQSLNPSFSGSTTQPLIQLGEQGSSRSCSLSVTLVSTPPLDTSSYTFAYYEEGSKSWQIQFGDKGKKPQIDTGASPSFCNVIN